MCIVTPTFLSHRLCYELQLHSGCPLGEPPITCVRDECAGQTCAGFPDAVCRVYGCGDTCEPRWYDGQTGQWVQCKREWGYYPRFSGVITLDLVGLLPRFSGVITLDLVAFNNN